MNESMRYGKQKKVINRWKNTNWDDAKQQQQSRDSNLESYKAYSGTGILFIYHSVWCWSHKHLSILACSIFCDSYEITWFWQPESTLHRHWKFRFCTDIWPAVFILYTFRFNYRSKKHRGLGGSVFRDGVLYSCIWLVEQCWKRRSSFLDQSQSNTKQNHKCNTKVVTVNI